MKYEKHNQNSNDSGKRPETSEQQGISILGDDRGFQRKEVFTIGKCENTTQAGTGGFFKQRAELGKDETIEAPIDKIIQNAFRMAGFKATGRMKKDIEFKRKMAKYFRENGCSYEEIRIALGYKSISGVQRILGH